MAMREIYERYVVRQEGCWGWTGPSERVPVGGRDQSVHFISWVVHYGPIPNKLSVIRRSCDSPVCANPEHLYLVVPELRRCSIEGCRDVHFSNDYCCKHYFRVRRHGDPDYYVGKGRIGPRGKLKRFPGYTTW